VDKNPRVGRYTYRWYIHWFDPFPPNHYMTMYFRTLQLTLIRMMSVSSFLFGFVLALFARMSLKRINELLRLSCLFFFLMMASIFNAFAVTIFACSYDLRKNLAYNELLTQTSPADVFILEYQYEWGFHLSISASVLYFVIALICLWLIFHLDEIYIRQKDDFKKEDLNNNENDYELNRDIPAYLVPNMSRDREASVFSINSPDGQLELNKMRSRQGSKDLRHLFREQPAGINSLSAYTANQRSMSVDLVNRRMKKVSVTRALPHINEDSEGSIHSERRISILSTRSASASVYSSSKSVTSIKSRPSQIAQVAIVNPSRRFSFPIAEDGDFNDDQEDIKLYKL